MTEESDNFDFFTGCTLCPQNCHPSASMNSSSVMHGIWKCLQIFGILAAFGLSNSIVTTVLPSVAALAITKGSGIVAALK